MSPSALVQGSAGFVGTALAEVAADVVMLGIGGLKRLGREYARDYWDETVVMTKAARVFPVHFDDFTAPFGELVLFPKLIDDVAVTAGWIDEFARVGETPVLVEQLPLGEPLILY